MAFTLTSDTGVWSDADLTGDAYANAMWALCRDIMSLNFTKNVGLTVAGAVNSGSNVLNISTRLLDGGLYTANCAFPVGTPVVIGRPNIDPLAKPLLRYGTVTAISATQITVNVTSTNGITDSSPGGFFWFIVACQPSFDISGTIALPGGTGQTTAIASRKALKLLRPTDGFEVREDFVGYVPDVTSAASSQAFLSRFYAACANGGKVKVGGQVDYLYTNKGRHPGVAVLSASNAGDVAGVSFGASPNIQFGNVSNLYVGFNVYLPKLTTTKYIFSVGLFCTNGGGTLKQFLVNSSAIGQGIVLAMTPERLIYGGVEYPTCAVDVTGASQQRNYVNSISPGWVKAYTYITGPTASPDFNWIDEVSGLQLPNYSLFGTNLTSQNNWMMPFAKIIKISGEEEAWAAIDFIECRGECSVAR